MYACKESSNYISKNSVFMVGLINRKGAQNDYSNAVRTVLAKWFSDKNYILPLKNQLLCSNNLYIIA